jgi:hypothetical protein
MTLEQLHEAIRHAYDAGETMEAIAAAAGLSRQRVSQVIKGRR